MAENTETQDLATPRPWRADGWVPWSVQDDREETGMFSVVHSVGRDGDVVLAEVIDAEDADLIVRAVNSHDALVGACEAALVGLNYMGDVLNASDMATEEGIAKVGPVFAMLNEALRLARGGA